jgi:hypothetical protein
MLDIETLHHSTLKYLLLAGFLERHPNLKFGYIESGSDWVAPILRQLDRYFGARTANPQHQLAMKPSEQWARQGFCAGPLDSREIEHGTRSASTTSCSARTIFTLEDLSQHPAASIKAAFRDPG